MYIFGQGDGVYLSMADNLPNDVHSYRIFAADNRWLSRIQTSSDYSCVGES